MTTTVKTIDVITRYKHTNEKNGGKSRILGNPNIYKGEWKRQPRRTQKEQNARKMRRKWAAGWAE